MSRRAADPVDRVGYLDRMYAMVECCHACFRPKIGPAIDAVVATIGYVVHDPVRVASGIERLPCPEVRTQQDLVVASGLISLVLDLRRCVPGALGWRLGFIFCRHRPGLR